MMHPLSRLRAALGDSSRGAAARRRTAAPRIELLETRLTPCTIAGVAYNDVGGVGVYQPGDPLYANNPISLANAAGTVIASTVTDANGHYSFSIDPTISTTPATLEQDLAFGPNSTDAPQSLQINQFDPSLGTLTGVDVIQAATLTSEIKVVNSDPVASAVEGEIQGTVTLQAPGAGPLATNVQADETATVQPNNGSLPAYDFGAKDASATSSVSLQAGTNDLSGFIGTGKATLTESGTAKVCVDGPGNLLSMVRSTVSGRVKVVYHYTPSSALRPGQYTVIQTANPPGTTDGVNTSNGVPVAVGTPADTIPVTLPPGGDSLHNDFGEVVPARVSGFVYLDNNLDGVFDGGDAPIPGAVVNISRLEPNGTPVFVASTTTAADGSYSFTVPTGTYTITQGGIPGLTNDADNIGSLGGFSGPGALTLYLPGGGDGLNYDFGYISPATILPPPQLPPPPEVPPPPPQVVIPPPQLPPPEVPPQVPPPPPPVTPPVTKFDFLASTAWDGDF